MLVIPAVTAFSLACHASLLIPQIHNPGFENGVDGWGWMTYNGAQASYRADDSNPHSGAQCLVIGFIPGMYPIRAKLGAQSTGYAVCAAPDYIFANGIAEA